MNQAFEVRILYNRKQLCLPAEFIVLENVYKILVEVNDQEITFEPDCEQKFRAIMNPKRLKAGKKIDVDLLKAIAVKLEEDCSVNI